MAAIAHTPDDPMDMTPVARGLAAPLQADPVDSPVVSCSGRRTFLNFSATGGGWGRVTFEKLDAIRVCRGEYDPYEVDWKKGDPRRWVYTVSPSPWLQERYQYERKHYGGAYEFGGDVEEMLRDFSHYLFAFHDEFVEVLAAGIWFESASELMGDRAPDACHPLLDLPATSAVEAFHAHGIMCKVRHNSRPLSELLNDASYCSQKLFQIAAVLDGRESVHWTVTVRQRAGKTSTFLRSSFGRVEETYDRIVAIADVRPRIDAWLGELAERRHKMGKR